jgi:trypsin
VILAMLAVGSLLLASIPGGGDVAGAADSTVPAGTAPHDMLVAAGGADQGPAPRIVGGVEVDPAGKYPFIAALVKHGGDAYWDQYCAGSVISADWVLTAAHCVAGETASTVDVVIGRHDLGSNAGERIRAARIIVHPGWDDDSSANDVALIRLADSTSFSPVALPADGSLEAAGTMLTAIGWGDTHSVPQWPYELREVQLPVVGDAACRAAYSGYIDAPTAVDVCAGDLDAGGIDTCQGDSGGPLFASTAAGFVQIGITSRSEGCAVPGYPGIYARVSAFTTWITNQTGVSPPAPPADTEGYLCFGREATIVGTDGADEIYGTAGDDVIVALTGPDLIYGLGGNDRICGGGGNDEIRPGPGNDRVKGGAGADLILGAEGNDLLKGGGGPDQVYGNAGDDRLVGQRGDDYLDGGPGIDVVKGRGGIDTCFGETRAACELPESAVVLDFESGTVHLPVFHSTDAVSTIAVGSSGTITDLDVGLRITHTWVGDLKVTLTHVSTGTTVILVDRPGTTVLPPPGSSVGDFGCPGHDVDAIFDDEAAAPAEDMCLGTAPTIRGLVRPHHPLSAFDGESPGGTWRLTVVDEATGDTGFLEDWSLHFQI